MSIYATLWVLRFPSDGDVYEDCSWIEVLAQGVPPHIGTPTPGHGYERGDPYASFLPPPIPVDADGDAALMRAVVIVKENTAKGTGRSHQEYVNPLLVLSGAEYSAITFSSLHEKICDRLRGAKGRVVAELKMPGRPNQVIREDGA